MRTRSSSNLIVESFTIPKRCNRRRSKQIVKPELHTIEEIPVATMADTRTMSKLLQAPTKGYRDAIVIPAILAENFELQVGLLSITTNLKNNIKNFQQKFDETFSEAWDRFKDLLRKCPHHGISELHQIDTFYNSLTQSDQDSLNTVSGATSTYNQGGNEYRLQGDPNYHVSNQMGPPDFPLPNMQNNQNRYNQNQENYQAPNNQAQVGPSHDFSNYMKTNDVNMRAMQNQISNIKTELKNEFKTTMLNQNNELRNMMSNEIKNMMSSFIQMQSPSGSGSLPSNTIANPEVVKRDIEATKDKVQATSKFTFPADFVVVGYDVDPRVPLILGRPFLRTVRALVDVHGEELILRDVDEQLIFHADSTSKHPHKHREESINMINFINITCEDWFPEVLKFKKSNHPSTDLREIEYLLNQDPSTESDIKTINPILEKFTDEPALAYLLPPEDNDDDDLFDLKSDNDEWKKLLYGDCYKDIDSKKDKNKDFKIKSLVVEAHIVESNALLPQLLDNDSTLLEESSEIASLSSSPFGNEDKVFNSSILILGRIQILKDESKDKDLRDKDLILKERNFLSISSDKELLLFLELTVI
uniref:Reverse transcriptase domain-containing protein n=1 Tax=Tanacetum cinerariifolium TaxID=118510 RepID=A0A6L2L2I4_TANCI|nr:reverse transcriptase domain-containing protein [Tanacetum cinerariifolium]